MTTGLVLYGPPAAGKDTITNALHALSYQYVLFPRLKVGGGRHAEYRVIDQARLDALRTQGEIVWLNEQYGATYAIDRAELTTRLAASVPVVHVGQPAAVAALVTAWPATQWHIVALRCPRATAAARLAARSPFDAAERLRVWDETPTLPGAELTLDTATIQPDDAARTIHQRVVAGQLSRIDC